jgi:hypothetical protein
MLTFTRDAYGKLVQVIRETEDGRETGGALLGYENAGKSIVIEDIGGPNPFGVMVERSPMRFLLQSHPFAGVVRKPRDLQFGYLNRWRPPQDLRDSPLRRLTRRFRPL